VYILSFDANEMQKLPVTCRREFWEVSDFVPSAALSERSAAGKVPDDGAIVLYFFKFPDWRRVKLPPKSREV